MRIFNLLASTAEKRPWLVVVCVVIVTIFMGIGMTRVTTELSQEAMMPQGYESVKTMEAVGEKFGGLFWENVLVTADDASSSRVALILMGLTAEKLQEEGFKEGEILKVETYLDALKKQCAQENIPLPSSKLELGIAVGNLLSSDYAKEQLIGKVISEDGKATLIRFQVKSNLPQDQLVDIAKRLEDLLNREFSNVPGSNVYVSGVASMQKDFQEFIYRETGVLFLAAVLFIMLILYLTFRRITDIVLPLLIIVVAIEWVLGFMGWAGVSYTFMSVAIMPLLLGINIAYVIHIISRYYEERETGENPFEAINNSVKTVGVAVFLTAVTTMIGFASFMIADIPPLRDFGMLCVLGIGFSFLLTLTLLPAIIVIRDRRKEEEKLNFHLEKMRGRRRESRYGLWIDRALVWSALVSERHHWTVAIVTVVLVAVSVFGVFNLKTGADIRKMMPEHMSSFQAENVTEKHFGPQEPEVILVEGDIYEPENLAAVLELEDRIPADERNHPEEEGYYSREGIISIADLILYFNQGKIPESSAEVKAVVTEIGKQVSIESFVANDGNDSLIIVRSAMPETEDEMKVKTDILRENASRVEKETGMELSATGMQILISDLMGKLVPTQIKTSALALLLCALVLMLVFKSVTYGLATLSVVVCGVIIEIIFLWVMGWPLDIMTVTISALVIGAGIDFGIHITYRFREEWHHGEIPLKESIKRTVLHVGRALVAAAFTTAGVFAILGLSNLVPMQRFGFATAIALIGALLGAVFVLPSLLAILAKRQEEKSAAPEAEPTVELADE